MTVLAKKGRKYGVPFLVDHVRNYLTNDSLPIKKINFATLTKQKLFQPNVFMWNSMGDTDFCNI
jgi:hypothetical protein